MEKNIKNVNTIVHNLGLVSIKTTNNRSEIIMKKKEKEKKWLKSEK